jgi:hypothetical protein
MTFRIVSAYVYILRTYKRATRQLLHWDILGMFLDQDDPRWYLRVAKDKETELHETWSSEGGDHDDYWSLVMWLRVVWHSPTFPMYVIFPSSRTLKNERV